MGKETVMVIDGGGRGSALVDKHAQSPNVGRVLAIPGNDLMGINTDKEVKIFQERDGKKLTTTHVPEIVEICHEENVTLADVCQDDAVAVGLVNELEKRGIPVVGPTRKAGQIEWSKVWERGFGERVGLPQPSFWLGTTVEDGIEFINTQSEGRWFIKADGLAQGKGALLAHSNIEAIERIDELKRRFPEAAKLYLIEKCIEGEEFSTFVFSDGENYKIVGSAQDHKRIYDGDVGENTGGIGCSSPPLILTPEILNAINKRIFTRTIRGLAQEGRHYKGVLYLGGMVANGNPYVIEFNARWGDPEAQVILPGLIGDLFEISQAIIAGDINSVNFSMDGKSRVVVAGASKGYPGNYDEVKGKRIDGLREAMRFDGVRVYGAGVKVEDGIHYANGGRLFYIVGEGENVIEARERAYQAMAVVSVEGNNLHCRADIGWRDVERLRQG